MIIVLRVETRTAEDGRTYRVAVVQSDPANEAGISFEALVKGPKTAYALLGDNSTIAEGQQYPQYTVETESSPTEFYPGQTAFEQTGLYYRNRVVPIG